MVHPNRHVLVLSRRILNIPQPLSGAEYRVYFYLCDLWKGVPIVRRRVDIARDKNLSVRAVRYALKRLEQEKLIIIHRGDSSTATAYSVVFDDAVKPPLAADALTTDRLVVRAYRPLNREQTVELRERLGGAEALRTALAELLERGDSVAPNMPFEFFVGVLQQLRSAA